MSWSYKVYRARVEFDVYFLAKGKKSAKDFIEDPMCFSDFGILKRTIHKLKLVPEELVIDREDYKGYYGEESFTVNTDKDSEWWEKQKRPGGAT